MLRRHRGAASKADEAILPGGMAIHGAIALPTHRGHTAKSLRPAGAARWAVHVAHVDASLSAQHLLQRSICWEKGGSGLNLEPPAAKTISRVDLGLEWCR